MSRRHLSVEALRKAFLYLIARYGAGAADSFTYKARGEGSSFHNFGLGVLVFFDRDGEYSGSAGELNHSGEPNKLDVLHN